MSDNRPESPSVTSDSELDALTELGRRLIYAVLEGQPLSDVQSLVEIDEAPVWYQEEDEGMSALHAAAYTENVEVVDLLLQAGAVWNAVDNLGNTAGDIALSLNNEAIYNKIRDTGIRAELLLSLMSSRSAASPTSLLLRNIDDSATGSTDAFLQSKLRFVKDEMGQELCLVEADGDEVGVMMGWEQNIMEHTVQKLCKNNKGPAEGPKVLNVGFGLGMIDSLFQQQPISPSLHAIIEPHPDVLSHMREKGWYDLPNVKIYEGKWQDVILREDFQSIGGFDVVYTDTFSEDYAALHQFFENLPDLLSGPGSLFSFFNGLGATNSLFYDVYTHLSELHLAEIGINVEWSDVPVANAKLAWGETRKYFTSPLYRLPVGKMRHM